MARAAHKQTTSRREAKGPRTLLPRAPKPHGNRRTRATSCGGPRGTAEESQACWLDSEPARTAGRAMHLGGPGSPVPGGISAVGIAAQLRAATAPQVPMVPRTHAFTHTLTRPPRSRQTPTYFDDPRDAGQGGELVGRSLAGGGGHQTQEGGLGGRRAWQGRPRPGSSRATPLSPHWSPPWPHPVASGLSREDTGTRSFLSCVRPGPARAFLLLAT